MSADLEHLGIGLADAQLAMAGLDVLGEHMHAAHQVLGSRGDRLAHQLRIGQNKIRRRDRIGNLPDVEIGFVQGVGIKPLGIMDQPLRPVDREQVGLLEKIEELIARPFRIGEALVARIGRRNRRDLLSGHALDRIPPEVEIRLAQARLQLEGALGVADPVIHDLAQRFDDVGHLRILVVDTALLARPQIGGQCPAPFLHDAGDVVGKLLDVGRAALDRFGGGSHGQASLRRGAGPAVSFSSDGHSSDGLCPERRKPG